MPNINDQVIIGPRPQIKKLTYDQFIQLSQALARLHEIRSTKIEGSILTRDKKNEAQELKVEAEALVEFLAATFIDHGQEFLGCWHVMKQEYEPLVNGAVSFFNRLAASSHDRAEQIRREAAAGAAKEVKVPDNVVKLSDASLDGASKTGTKLKK